MPSVLFVCTANICRSPMAEALLREMAAEDWRIASAGVYASAGRPATSLGVQVLDEIGIENQNHRSQPVNAELLESFNLILVMEPEHREFIRERFGEAGDRVYLLSEMIDQAHPIEDPIGGTVDMYRTLRQELQGILEASMQRIQRLASTGLSGP